MMDNLGAGIGIGIALGLAMGLGKDASDRRNDK
jgi:hypothetical protein